MSKHLDDMVREFREYAEGKNGYDELDFKADLLAWHREECLKIIGEDEPEQDGWNTEAREKNRLRAELRASLEVEDE